MISQKRMFEIVEKGHPDDPVSRFCDIFLFSLILINLIAVCLETVEVLYARYYRVFIAVEMISVAIFAAEYLARIWSSAAAPDGKYRTATGKRLSYIFSFTGLIDLLAILPSIIPLMFGGADLRWLRVLRLMRLLKFSHYSSALGDLAAAIRHERRAFVATLYLLILAVFLSSSMIYVVESEQQPEVFGSIPAAMWWTMVTLTTVGYGDVVPVTVVGKIIASFTALMGVSVVALLTGIVATGFATQLASKKDELALEVGSALEDGFISEEEQSKIEALRQQLNLTEQEAKMVIFHVKATKSKNP